MMVVLLWVELIHDAGAR